MFTKIPRKNEDSLSGQICQKCFHLEKFPNINTLLTSLSTKGIFIFKGNLCKFDFDFQLCQ